MSRTVHEREQILMEEHLDMPLLEWHNKDKRITMWKTSKYWCFHEVLFSDEGGVLKLG